MALEPIAGTIKELVVPDLLLDDKRGFPRCLLPELRSLERLETMGGDMASLRPIAQQLTHLTASDQLGLWGLDQAGFSRLESLTSDSASSDESMYAPVLTACRDTLRSLSLSTNDDTPPDWGLLAALGGLTHLTRLKLTLRHPGETLSAVLAALPPGLLENQLEYLSLALRQPRGDHVPVAQPQSSQAEPASLPPWFMHVDPVLPHP
ncbi:hypothetical protein PAPYR_8955 [Paratrimastix pyriformis]|uniref:Uncharacterized protein n=1 Tax=Paratrimastix pyriformis TaxID=342808 RepID=A0ABQ8UF27_9EUKA|nr:hypothetical protein PAPYR_8955 [Paratrimastix pyriformis]